MEQPVTVASIHHWRAWLASKIRCLKHGHSWHLFDGQYHCWYCTKTKPAVVSFTACDGTCQNSECEC